MCPRAGEPIQHAQHVVRLLAQVRPVQHQAVDGVEEIAPVPAVESVDAARFRTRFADPAHVAREHRGIRFGLHDFADQRFVAQLGVAGQMSHIQNRPRAGARRTRKPRLLVQAINQRLDARFGFHGVRHGLRQRVTAGAQVAQDPIVGRPGAGPQFQNVRHRARQGFAGHFASCRRQCLGFLPRELKHGACAEFGDLAFRRTPQLWSSSSVSGGSAVASETFVT